MSRQAKLLLVLLLLATLGLFPFLFNGEEQGQGGLSCAPMMPSAVAAGGAAKLAADAETEADMAKADAPASHATERVAAAPRLLLAGQVSMPAGTPGDEELWIIANSGEKASIRET